MLGNARQCPGALSSKSLPRSMLVESASLFHMRIGSTMLPDRIICYDMILDHMIQVAC